MNNMLVHMASDGVQSIVDTVSWSRQTDASKQASIDGSQTDMMSVYHVRLAADETRADRTDRLSESSRWRQLVMIHVACCHVDAALVRPPTIKPTRRSMRAATCNYSTVSVKRD